jgi:lycopene beta-cyclase
VEKVRATSVELADGSKLAGRLVVDARGPERAPLADAAGYQKFVGLEVDLLEPHRMSRPLLMDARVSQVDGLRFVYLLPFGDRRLLLEDTYFSHTPQIDVPALRRGILAYAAERGFAVERVVREEIGVLPLPLRSPPPPRACSPIVAGYRGGWFHPATAYSLPVAMRLALHVAANVSGSLFDSTWQRFVRAHRVQFRFGTLLNRMLFGAFLPEERWNAFERFYRLPDETIRRFYALETTRLDRIRMVCGRPPRGLSLRAVAGATP